MRIKLILAVLVCVLVGGIATAQTGCGDLSGEDCDIIRESEQVMGEIESATFTLDATLRLSDIFSDDENVMTIYASGVYDNFDPATLFLPEGDFAGDAALVLDFEGDVFALLGESPLALDLRLLQTIGYANLTKTIPEADGWYGVETVNLLIGLSGLIEVYNSAISGLGIDALVFVPFEVAPVERTSEMAVFRWTANFDNVLEDSFARLLFNEVINSLLDDDFTASEIEALRESYLRLLDDMTLEIERTIDLTDSTVQSLSIVYTLSPAIETLLAISETPDPLGLGDLPLEVEFALTVAQTELNEPVTIPIPQDAELMPFFEDEGSDF